MTRLAGVRPKTSGDPMIDIVPTGKILGATVNGLDLSQALADAAFDQILRALGRYGVLRFPHQALKPAAQKAFASRFGSLEVHVAGLYQDPEHPEIMFLSNIVENGKPIGLADAGSSCACPPRSALAAPDYAEVMRPAADGMNAANKTQDFGTSRWQL
jgi:hypothetical protein